MGLLVPNLRPDLEALRLDVAVAALRDVVKDGWSVLGLSTGMVDAFVDQSGIASLGGATYDGAAKTVSNPANPVAISGATGTPIGNLTGGGGLASGFDGNTAAGAGVSPYNTGSGGGSNPNLYLGKYWGAGNAKTVTQVVVYPTTDSYGFSGSNGLSLTFNVQGSNDNAAWTQLGTLTFNTGIGMTAKTIACSGGAYLYHRLNIVVPGGSYDAFCSELVFYVAGAPSAVTVVSSAFALGFQPSQARVVMPVELGGGAIGTDCMLDLSRDGAAWAAVPLSDLGKFDASTRIVGGLVSLAGQPGGSSIYWRWRTTAAYTLRNHGIWLQCK